MKIFGKELTFNNKKVYHEGNKPTASDINFTDGQTFQQKLDNGSLKGAKGDTGAKGATGAQGPQGIQGATGATGAKGVSMRLLGAWSSTTAYVNNSSYIDVVTSGGSTYACKTSNTNQAVTNTTYWTLIASKGDKGNTGATGATGATGPKGADGLTTSVTVGSTKYTHSSGNITIPAYPTALKNPNSLTVQFNGTTNKTYNGGSAQTVNITPSAIGAAASSHTHSYLPLSGGTMTGHITMNSSSAERRLLFTASGMQVGFYGNSTYAGMYDWQNSRGVFQYAHGGGVLTMERSTKFKQPVWFDTDVTMNYVHLNDLLLKTIDDSSGAANVICVDNGAGSNSQITFRPNADNKGNIGHKNYTWNYANITATSTASLPEGEGFPIPFTDNERMYDTIKDMNLYTVKDTSYDEDGQLQRSYRTRLITSSKELPFEVAPESHLEDGDKNLNLLSLNLATISALKEAIKKIEMLEEEIQSLKGE